MLYVPGTRIIFTKGDRIFQRTIHIPGSPNWQMHNRKQIMVQ